MLVTLLRCHSVLADKIGGPHEFFIALHAQRLGQLAVNREVAIVRRARAKSRADSSLLAVCAQTNTRCDVNEPTRSPHPCLQLPASADLRLHAAGTVVGCLLRRETVSPRSATLLVGASMGANRFVLHPLGRPTDSCYLVTLVTEDEKANLNVLVFTIRRGNGGW